MYEVKKGQAEMVMMKGRQGILARNEVVCCWTSSLTSLERPMTEGNTQ